MNRKAIVLMYGYKAGELEETPDGYVFQYDAEYLENPDTQAISLTLPLTEKAYTSPTLFSFFDGLIPEGWLLDVAHRTWKLDPRDRMGLLLACCKDCIGAVSIILMDTETES